MMHKCPVKRLKFTIRQNAQNEAKKFVKNNVGYYAM